MDPLCEHWKDIHQRNIRCISEMECLYFMACKMIDRVESWLVLPCFRTVWHLFPKWRCWGSSFKGETPTIFFALQKYKLWFTYKLKVKNEHSSAVFVLGSNVSYAELFWNDSSSFLLSCTAEQNRADCAAVILQTCLNFSVYLWVSTNTLCILLPCVECFYFPLI